MSDTHSLAADLDAGRACGGLSRSDERASSEPGCDGRLAARLETLSRQPRISTLYLDSGLTICSECFGSPNQYLIDFEETCPTCQGEGFVADPDYIDGDAPGFDPRAEWGTHHRTYSGSRR